MSERPGLGSGPDQGSDILIDVPHRTPLRTEMIPYVVQCKWTTSPLGHTVISDIISYLSVHRAKGLLIITSSHFSGTAVTKANALTQDVTNPYSVVLWDGSELCRRLQEFPLLISKYWHRESEGQYTGKLEIDIFPKYNRQTILDELAPRPRYRDSSADWYNSMKGYDESLRSRILSYIERYSASPTVLTIIQGGTGLW
jgi:hypothetical protein